MSYKADLKNLQVDQIDRNPENPRIFFRQEEMEQLYVSIKNKGLLQPIAVYKDGDRYIIIDGERRWRTFLKLNYKTIPAIIQEKPSPLDNLLLMFNIHSTREQWDIFTIAMKIERVVKLLTDKLGYEPTEIDLSIETGMTRGTIRRCKTIIALPERFKEILRIELEKPKKEQIFSEDFFLEMENSLRAVRKNYPEFNDRIDYIRDVLLEKYRNKIINNIVDFRKLTKIATAWKNINYSRNSTLNLLNKLFLNNNVSIEEIYKNSVESYYDDKVIINNANNFFAKVENLDFNDLVDNDLRDVLLKIKTKIEILLNL